MLDGLLGVLAGRTVGGDSEYPCYSPSVKALVHSRITSIDAPLGGAVASHVNITRRKALEQELARQALHDPLPGLANRELFIRKVTEAHADRRAGQDGPDVGLLYVDLDDFNPVNDTYGHATGDEVLLTAAHRLRSGRRPQHVVARLGGDESAVLATSIGANGLAALAARLGEALAEPHCIHRRQVHVGGSVGTFRAGPGEKVSEALNAADRAMYLVKNARPGRTSRR